MKRICSSSTLIAGDLAKRSPKHPGPAGLEDYNSCASSALHQPPLQITNGEVGGEADELADMMWNAASEEQSHDRVAKDDVQPGSGGSPGPHLSPPRMNQVIGVGYSQGQGYSILEGQKYDGDGNGNGNGCDIGSSGRAEVGLVHQAPTFALWSE